MKALPIIIAVLVAVTLIRLRRRSQGSGSPSPIGSLASRMHGSDLLGETGLVMGREIRERVRGRLFRVVTIILFGVVAAAVVIPTVRSGRTTTPKVGIVAASVSLETELHDLARSVGISVQLVDERDLSQAKTALDTGKLDVVASTTMILVKNPISANDTSPQARYIRSASEVLGAREAYARAGLTTEQAAVLAQAKPLPVNSIHPGRAPRTTAEATALIGVILIFIVLTQYLTWTLMGVMEEKASRVVEVLLATLRPIQLLGGKVIGIAVVVLAQAIAVVAFALILAQAVGSSLIHGAAPLVVVSTLVWLILGYSFYSWVYAAAGSLAERQDQVQSLALPLSAPLIFGYIICLIGVSSGHVSQLVKVLAYVPPTAPFAMPTLVGFSQATWWEFVVSVVISLACTVLVALAAARVYRTAVLQTGGRVRLRLLVPISTD